MNSVFDPGVFFISLEEWNNQQKQDEFVAHLLDNLKIINEYKLSKIYWSDELEVFLWESPQLPPWRLTKDWSNKIIPIIYKMFINNRILLVESREIKSCSVSPLMLCTYGREEIQDCFLKLMHVLIRRGDNILLCLGKDNRLINESFNFYCDCHPLKLRPPLIRISNQWLNHADLEQDYWPQNKDEIEKLKVAIEIEIKRSFPEEESICKFSFSRSFIEDIIRTANHKDKILKAIAKRLTLTRQKASQDANLQDEFIEQEKEFRFRVTPRPTSTRIHYNYVDANNIEFLRYYGEGEHDEGL